MSGKIIALEKRRPRARATRVEVGANDTFDVEHIVLKLAGASGEIARAKKSAEVAEKIAKRNASLEPPRKIRRDKPEVF